VVDKANAKGDVALQSRDHKIEIIECSATRQPRDAALRRADIDVIEVLEVHGVLDLAEHREGVAPLRGLGDGRGRKRQPEAIERGRRGNGDATEYGSARNAHATLRASQVGTVQLIFGGLCPILEGPSQGPATLTRPLSSHSRGRSRSWTLCNHWQTPNGPTER